MASLGKNFFVSFLFGAFCGGAFVTVLMLQRPTSVRVMYASSGGPSASRAAGAQAPHRSNEAVLPPSDPHNHGNFEVHGPEIAQNWSESHQHDHDDDSVAAELYKKVRIVCWIMTSPSNIKSKAVHIKATWAKRCNKYVFISSAVNNELPAVKLDVKEGRNELWGKTKAAFRYCYDHLLQDGDWFLKADDDTYVIVENLRHMLRNYSSEQPIYFGRRFKPYVKQGYMSGGAGYVLSRKALTTFIEQGLNKSICRRDNGGAEDVEMGLCLEKVKVVAGDSRDPEGKERFHPFVPEHHLIRGILPKNMWYWSYNYFPAKEGPDCCSDYAVTFHYVAPNLMYILEYLIYHLKPYGISTHYSIPKTNALPHQRIVAPSGGGGDRKNKNSDLQTNAAATAAGNGKKDRSKS
ncbi:glycoprotein-N-acetylgalactosamine 3-beta-galactosyltransferase 1-like [Tubulanus polymorphus]|uniref:glycoprotein-N-acetylgalactosamine 3-beta-galactosyltransferase 1-like n=1 Tax=Tubulanus polymorphus TaxID=672921 RepID=UPI003DA2A9FF